MYTKGSQELRVLIYVDDLVLASNDLDLLTKFKSYLGKCFKMKDLGRLKYFLDIEVARSEEGIFISQTKYVLDIISDTGLLGCKPVTIPLEQYHNLAADQSLVLSETKEISSLSWSVSVFVCYSTGVMLHYSSSFSVYETAKRGSLVRCSPGCSFSQRLSRPGNHFSL